MPNLKDLKVRIDSVKSTQKITSAMKMVAAAKLRRAQEQAEASRPYAQRMDRMLGSLAAAGGGAGRRAETAGRLRWRPDPSDPGGDGRPRSLRRLQLLHRARGAADLGPSCRSQGKTVKFFCVGRKGRDQLRRDFGEHIDRHHRRHRQAEPFLRQGRRHRRARRRHVRGRRVRRLHHDLCRVPLGDFADRHPAAADPLRSAEERRRRGRGRRPQRRGLRVRARRGRDPDGAAADATSPCRSSRRCWRTRPASTARG